MKNDELWMMNEEKNAPTVVGYTNSLLHKNIAGVSTLRFESL